MIEVRGLTKRYGEKVAVNDLTVRVDGQRYSGLANPMREVGALLDAKAVHGGRSAYNHAGLPDLLAGRDRAGCDHRAVGRGGEPG